MIGIGLVGCGFVAVRRAEAIATDERARLVAVSARNPKAFAQTFGVKAIADWRQLIQLKDVDLVGVTHINCEHAQVVAAALEAGKHVVVEYPLALEIDQAARLIELAHRRQRLLHIEHIELLGGLHRAAAEHLAAVGTPQYVRYSTISPKHPAPSKWSYEPALFGFPLMGAQSRIHRLTQLFGRVRWVSAQTRYDNVPIVDFVGDRFSSCLCLAQLGFASGFIAEITYGKGEGFWRASRRLEIQGDEGTLLFQEDIGMFINAAGEQPIAVGKRRGLIREDTYRVLDYLTEGRPLYSSPEESLYSLRVADAARRAAENQTTIELAPTGMAL